MTCKQTMTNGELCKANAMTGSDYCFTHNPETREQVKEAGKKGGQVCHYDKGLVRAETIDILTDNKMVIYLLADTINRVRKVRPDGSIDIRTANCIGFLTSKLLEAQQVLDTDLRLDKIEKALTTQGVLK